MALSKNVENLINPTIERSKTLWCSGIILCLILLLENFTILRILMTSGYLKLQNIYFAIGNSNKKMY